MRKMFAWVPSGLSGAGGAGSGNEYDRGLAMNRTTPARM